MGNSRLSNSILLYCCYTSCQNLKRCVSELYYSWAWIWKPLTDGHPRVGAQIMKVAKPKSPDEIKEATKSKIVLISDREIQ